MEARCQSLLAEGFGAEAVALVRFQHMLEKINQYGSMKSVDSLDMNSLYADINVELFQNELEELRRYIPAESLTHRMSVANDNLPIPH